MHLKEITEKEFKQYNSIVLNFTEGKPSQLGRVVDINQSITINIGWDGEIVKPTLLKFGDFLLIGVNFRVAIIDLEAKILSCFLPLYSDFTEFIPLDDAIIILAELEVFILNKNGLSIRTNWLLPDILEEYEIVERTIILKCMDSSIEKIKF